MYFCRIGKYTVLNTNLQTDVAPDCASIRLSKLEQNLVFSRSVDYRFFFTCYRFNFMAIKVPFPSTNLHSVLPKGEMCFTYWSIQILHSVLLGVASNFAHEQLSHYSWQILCLIEWDAYVNICLQVLTHMSYGGLWLTQRQRLVLKPPIWT